MNYLTCAIHCTCVSLRSLILQFNKIQIMLDLTIFSKLFIENFHQLLEDVVTPKNHQTADEAMMQFKVRHKITVCMLKKTK